MPATIEEPEAPRYVRSATSIARAVIGLCLILVALVLGRLLRSFDAELAASISRSFLALPRWVSGMLVISALVVVSVATVGVLVALIARRLWKLLLVLLVAQGVTVVLVAVLRPPAVPLDGATQAALRSLEEVLSSGGVLSVRTVGWLTVLASVAAAWLGRTWARRLWVAMAIFSAVWWLATPDSGAAVVIAIGSGVLGAAVASYALGIPNRRPRGTEIVAAFGRAGLELASLKTASVDARGSTPYFGTTADGRDVFIKVLAEDERSSDLLFRAYRFALFKNLGDFRPFSSLRRAVEHEALVALWASANGIRTPAVAAVATVGDDGIGLAYERIDGRSLDGVDEGELDETTLAEAWRLIAQMRAHGIAHRDLRLANVFLAADGRPWMIDFGFSELAATDDQLRTDIAEFLSSTAVKVGPERAIDACLQVITPEELGDAAPRLQPMALSSATRKALDKQKGLSNDLQRLVVDRTGAEKIQFEKLQRIRVANVVSVFALLAAFYLLAPQFAGFRSMWSHVNDIRWSQTVPAIVASALTYVGAAATLTGGVPSSIPFGLTFLAQLAGSFVNRIVPGRVGGMATNVLFLQKQGIDTPVAVAGVGVQQVTGVLVHIAMSAVFVFTVGAGEAGQVWRNDVRLIIEIVIGVLLLTGLLLLIPWIRHKVVPRVVPPLRRSAEGLKAVAHDPKRLGQLVGGATLMNLCYIGVLVLSVRAFGGTASFAAVAVAYLLGVAVASAAPTPGGIGAVEAALTAALIAVGVPKDIALPAVLLFRFVTFWLPVIPGWIALVYLQRRDAL